jgi:hypothetical protein
MQMHHPLLTLGRQTTHFGFTDVGMDEKKPKVCM